MWAKSSNLHVLLKVKKMLQFLKNIVQYNKGKLIFKLTA